MRTSALKRLLLLFGATIAVFGIGSALVLIYLQIRSGHGADGWINAYGQPESWGSAAGAVIAIAITAIAVWAYVWIYLWRRSRQEGVSMKQLWKEIRRRAQ
jgi:hypothetical protein